MSRTGASFNKDFSAYSQQAGSSVKTFWNWHRCRCSINCLGNFLCCHTAKLQVFSPHSTLPTTTCSANSSDSTLQKSEHDHSVPSCIVVHPEGHGNFHNWSHDPFPFHVSCLWQRILILKINEGTYYLDVGLLSNVCASAKVQEDCFRMDTESKSEAQLSAFSPLPSSLTSPELVSLFFLQSPVTYQCPLYILLSVHCWVFRYCH